MRLNITAIAFLIATFFFAPASTVEAKTSRAERTVALLLDGFGGRGAITNAVNLHAEGAITDPVIGKPGIYGYYLTQAGQYRADAIFGLRRESRVRSGDAALNSTGGPLKRALHEAAYRIEFEHKSLGLMYSLLAGKLDAEYSGMGFSGGRKYEKLTLYDPSGPALMVILDPRTRRVIQTSMDSGYGEQGTFRMEFSDYRDTGGLILPHSFSMYIGGELIGDASIEKFTFNTEVSPGLFKK